MSRGFTRRQWIAAAGAAGVSLWPATRALMAADEEHRFRIGACDWSLKKRGKINALKIAKNIGLDGVEVSFGKPGDRADLRKEEVRKEYLETSKSLGVEICSLAMGVLNSVPYATSAEAEKWVKQCVDVMEAMGQKRVLLAFFGRGDIRGKKELQDNVIRRLKRVAPKAQEAGVILGIESTMTAEEHIHVVDSVGSPAVKVYYDVANMQAKGHDVPKEICQLGDRICQVHAKENGFLLGQGRVDFPAVKNALDEIGYRGWLVIEGATVRGKSLSECYIANKEYLQKVFWADA